MLSFSGVCLRSARCGTGPQLGSELIAAAVQVPGLSARHCASREDACQKMAATLIELLLTTAPASSTPNKWTKLWKSSGSVAMGIIINSFPPRIFDLAFQSFQFQEAPLSSAAASANRRLVEWLYFHEVHGKRFLASREFLSCAVSQWAVRQWFIASEFLRSVPYHWLECLTAVRHGQRFPLFEHFERTSSTVRAVLQNIAHLIFDTTGSGLCVTWMPSGRSTFSKHSQQVRDFRRLLLNLSAWVFRRHWWYWEQLPWPWVVLADPEASPATKADIAKRWDEMHPCCVRAGLARSLKKLGVNSDLFLVTVIGAFDND